MFSPMMKNPSVPKLPIYVAIPYIKDTTFQVKLRQIVSKYFGAVDLKLIPVNPLKIGSYFKAKEKLQDLMTSGVIYKYSCPRCNRGTYIGSTRRLLKVRIDAHRGVSYRTGSNLTNPEFSCIRNHSKQCRSKIRYDNFKIISRASSDLSLSILESLTIKRLVPSLNTQTTSTPLYIS